MGKLTLEFLKDDHVKWEITGKNEKDIMKTVKKLDELLK